MSRPFALLVTWHTYGSWLPGDNRGHVSNVLLPEGGFIRKNNAFGSPPDVGDEFTRKRARQAMTDDPVWLSAEQALWVAEALVAAARARAWRILRGAVTANHVHALVADCPDDGSKVRRVLKGVSQAALSDRVGASHRWWAAGGSDRYKHDDAAITAADRYVANQAFMLAEVIDNCVRSRG